MLVINDDAHIGTGSNPGADCEGRFFILHRFSSNKERNKGFEEIF